MWPSGETSNHLEFAFEEDRETPVPSSVSDLLPGDEVRCSSSSQTQERDGCLIGMAISKTVSQRSLFFFTSNLTLPDVCYSAGKLTNQPPLYPRLSDVKALGDASHISL